MGRGGRGRGVDDEKEGGKGVVMGGGGEGRFPSFTR